MLTTSTKEIGRTDLLHPIVEAIGVLQSLKTMAEQISEIVDEADVMAGKHGHDIKWAKGRFDRVRKLGWVVDALLSSADTFLTEAEELIETKFPTTGVAK